MNTYIKLDDYRVKKIIPQPDSEVIETIDGKKQDIADYQKNIQANQDQIIHFQNCIAQAESDIAGMKAMSIKSEIEESSIEEEPPVVEEEIV